MPSLPLHIIVHSLQCQTVVSTIVDVLKTIYQIPNYVTKSFRVTAFQESENIKKVNKDIFKSKNFY